MIKFEDNAVLLVKEAFKKYFIEKDVDFILDHASSNDDIPLFGVVKPDWECEYAIISEYERVHNVSDSVCMVSARVSLKDITRPQINEETVVNGTFLCKDISGKIAFTSIHLSQMNGRTFNRVMNGFNDTIYNKALKHIYDVVLEYDALNNNFSYDPLKYREMFQVDTHFVSMDQWFWSMCTDCLHADDVDLLDIFRNSDISKRVRNENFVVSNDIRIRNKEKGFIWVNMVVVFIPNEARNNIAKVFVLFKNVDDKKKKELSFIEKSKIDRLTGLYTKDYFERVVSDYIAVEDKYALAIIDIDGYRAINDKFGRISSDEILVKIAKIVEKNTPSHDIIGRIGGDEFAVLIKFENDKAKMKELAEKMISETRFEYKDENTSQEIKCSVGIAVSDETTKTFEDIYEKADKNIFEAKLKPGKNAYVVN
ncbi:diguanylate cyclase (GGDEF) domain-containing protein [Lachnospiraceae bacterium RM5]|nr:diguanylate cyclase (GGDEF) domain-containing protein [Lachnospiraceae bacterium RM5]